MLAWPLPVLVIAASCTAVVVLALLRQRRAGEGEDPSGTPDVIEYMTMMIGVVYAIMLGLAVAGVWEGRSAAEDWVRREAQALHEVNERFKDHPPGVRERIRDDIDAYVGYTVAVEWPHMVEHGGMTERGTRLFHRVRRDVSRYEPRTPREERNHMSLVDQVAAADEARNARAQGSGPTLPAAVWLGLIAGAVISVGMVFVLQIRRSGRELVLAVLFTGLIAFLLLLVWYFDSPFVRGLGTPTEPFTLLFPEATGD